MLGPTVVTLSILLFAVGVALIGVSANVLDTQSFQGLAAGAVFNGTGLSSFWTISIIAPGVSYASLKASVAAGRVGVAAAVVIVVGFFQHSKQLGRLYAVTVAIGLSVITGIMAFVWSFVSTYTSDYAYHGPFPESFGGYGRDNVGDRGSYSFESWNCQTVALRVPDQRGECRRWCALTKSSRWLTLPFLIVSIALMSIWLLDARRNGWARGPPEETELRQRKAESASEDGK